MGVARPIREARQEMIEAGTVMFSADRSDEAVSEARDYIRRFDLTGDDVRLLQRDKSTIIISKRQFNDGEMQEGS